MLIQFSVKNFMSFKEKAILSLSPSKDTEHPENISSKNGYNANNLIAIYGANASGKPSLFNAMTVALNLIRNSNYLQVHSLFLQHMILHYYHYRYLEEIRYFFTEKNNKTGESDLYSLDEMPVRKTDNVEKGYLLGRYGAIPYICGEEL